MKALKIAGIALVIVLGGILFVSLSIDGIVKSQLEGTLSATMKTEVEVEDVDISILGGESEIEGLSIKNPEEFTDRDAIYLDEMYMDLDVRSLLSEQITIEEFIIEGPEIFVEQKGIGVNLRELNNNMSEGSDSEDSGKGMIIEQLVVENGTIEVSTEIEKERTVTAELDQLEVNGIGKANSGTVQQGIRQVMKPIIDEALSEALKDGVIDQLENKARELLGG